MINIRPYIVALTIAIISPEALGENWDKANALPSDTNFDSLGNYHSYWQPSIVSGKILDFQPPKAWQSAILTLATENGTETLALRHSTYSAIASKSYLVPGATITASVRTEWWSNPDELEVLRVATPLAIVCNSKADDQQLSPPLNLGEFMPGLQSDFTELAKESSINHPNLPNCSYAGYKYGNIPIPREPATINVLDFGAKGDGQNFDGKAIQAALNRAADSGGGVVLIPEGIYKVASPLIISGNKVVLRGEGPAKSRIYFTKSLSDIHGLATDKDGKSKWSWGGGMLTIEPSQDNRRKSQHAVHKVINYDSVKNNVIEVSDVVSYKPGQWMLLSLDNPEGNSLFHELTGYLPAMKNYPWHLSTWMPRKPAINLRLQVAKAEGREITFHQPLQIYPREVYNPRICPDSNIIIGCGIEDVAISFNPKVKKSPHLKDKGYNAIQLSNAVNCWVRNLWISDCDNGIFVHSSKCVTVSEVRMVGRKEHHAFMCANSQDCLFTRYILEAPVEHGVHVSDKAFGNVWSDAFHAQGTFDSHRGLPFDNLRTNISMVNTGEHGGNGTTAGPIYGRRFCNWNILVLNNHPNNVHSELKMPNGAIVGIVGCSTQKDGEVDFKGNANCLVLSKGQRGSPSNLHRYQLARRLKADLKEFYGWNHAEEKLFLHSVFGNTRSTCFARSFYKGSSAVYHLPLNQNSKMHWLSILVSGGYKVETSHDGIKFTEAAKKEEHFVTPIDRLNPIVIALGKVNSSGIWVRVSESGKGEHNRLDLFRVTASDNLALTQ